MGLTSSHYSMFYVLSLVAPKRKDNVLNLFFVFIVPTFIKLRDFKGTSRTKMWPKIRKLLLLGCEARFL